MTMTPVLVSFAVTRRCNLRCPHCYSESVEEPHPRELNTDEACAVIHDVAAAGTRMIIFDGGEPTLREDLPILVEHAAREGLAPLLGTNGMLECLTPALV
ncbi:MAG: radical SAM protein, partial [Deltaproteobacteria bacterium]|nr:radical SAM protein [Deltaproteobacteria bacterium]